MNGKCALFAAMILTAPVFAQEPASKITVDKSEIARVLPYTSFAPLVEKVAPSVVRVYTTKTFRPQMLPPEWRRFFGGGGGPEGKEQGLGSGVIVSADGYIVTNNHVTDGADEILVSLGMDRKEYTAKKIGSDPGTDIAVLKIDAKGLPAVAFADSDKAKVGDIVLAVGNPFGLTQTVTMGIVSGVGRGGMGITSYENFIQTDASINPGNSGGALVDTSGRVVGINTAILSRGGDNAGIGLAVPSNLVRAVLTSIREKGKVVRGFLGTKIQPLTAELGDAFKLKTLNGALISQVTPGSPAESAGLKGGDIILAVNGLKMDDGRTLKLTIGGMAPGSDVEVKYLRDGKEETAHAKLAEMPVDERTAGAGEQPAPKVSNILDGITVGDLDGQARNALHVPAGMKGAVITQIDPASAGYEAGLREGYVIEEMNQQEITGAAQAVALSEKIEKSEKVLLRVWSNGDSRYVALEKK